MKTKNRFIGVALSAVLLSIVNSTQAQTSGARGVTTFAPETSTLLPFEDFCHKGSIGLTIAESDPRACSDQGRHLLAKCTHP